MKIATIKLSYPHINPNEEKRNVNMRYRVDQVIDTVDYQPGDFLLKPEVKILCEGKAWRVVVVPSKA